MFEVHSPTHHNTHNHSTKTPPHAPITGRQLRNLGLQLARRDTTITNYQEQIRQLQSERIDLPEHENIYEMYVGCLLEIKRWAFLVFATLTALLNIVEHPRVAIQNIFFIFLDELFKYGVLSILLLVARRATSVKTSRLFCYAFIVLSFLNNITYVFTGASATNGITILTSTFVMAKTGIVVVPSTKDIYTAVTKKKENDEKCCTWLKSLCEGGVRLGAEGSAAYESLHSDELVNRVLLQGHVCTKAATPFTVNKVLEKRKHCRPDIGDTIDVSQLRNTFLCLLPDEAVVVAQKCGKGDAVLCTK